MASNRNTFTLKSGIDHAILEFGKPRYFGRENFSLRVNWGDGSRQDINSYSSDGFMTQTITYTVKVESGQLQLYNYKGESAGYPTLLEGNTYRFDQSDPSNENHPLGLSLTQDGTEVSDVTRTGTPGQSGAMTVYEVPKNSYLENKIWTRCMNHNGMGQELTLDQPNLRIYHIYKTPTTSSSTVVIHGGFTEQVDHGPFIDSALLCFSDHMVRSECAKHQDIERIDFDRERRFYVHGHGDFKDCENLTNTVNQISILSSTNPFDKIQNVQTGKIRLNSTFENCAMVENNMLRNLLFLTGNQIVEFTRVFKDSKWDTPLDGAFGTIDLSNVENFSHCFAGSSYSHSINKLNFTAATDMSYMFADNKVYSLPILIRAPKLLTVEGMFYGSSFSSRVSIKETSLLQNTSYLFAEMNTFPEYADVDFNEFDTSSATDMSYMFYNNKSSALTNFPFNKFFATDSATNLEGMFKNSSFNFGLHGKNITNVTNLKDFLRGTNFNSYFLKLQTGNNVETLSGAFAEGNIIPRFFQDSFDITSVTDLSFLFYKNTAFSQNLNFLNTSNVSNFESTFEGSVYNYSLRGWNVLNGTNFKNMFKNSEFTGQSIHLSWFNGAAGADKNCSGMFMNSKLDNVNQLKDWNWSAILDTSFMFAFTKNFSNNLLAINVSNVINFESMFEGSNYNGRVDYWNPKSAISMRNIFKNAKLFNQNCIDWFSTNRYTDTCAIEDMSGMFEGSAGYGFHNKWSRHKATVISAERFLANSTASSRSQLRTYRIMFVNCPNLEYLGGFFSGTGIAASAIRDNVVKTDLGRWFANPKVASNHKDQINFIKGINFLGALGSFSPKDYEVEDTFVPIFGAPDPIPELPPSPVINCKDILQANDDAEPEEPPAPVDPVPDAVNVLYFRIVKS